MCVAWDGAAGTILVSIDGAPYVAPFPTETPVRPSATAGAGLYPAIWGDKGSVVEWSLSGGLVLAPPSADYAPYATLQVPPPPTFPHPHQAHPATPLPPSIPPPGPPPHTHMLLRPP